MKTLIRLLSAVSIPYITYMGAIMGNPFSANILRFLLGLEAVCLGIIILCWILSVFTDTQDQFSKDLKVEKTSIDNLSNLSSVIIIVMLASSGWFLGASIYTVSVIFRSLLKK